MGRIAGSNLPVEVSKLGYSPEELVGRPASSLLDEVLSPIDRDVFERQVRYHSVLQRQPDAGSGANKDLLSGEKR